MKHLVFISFFLCCVFASARTLIIGGGISGLETARILSESGQEVIVIESEERLGGRVNSQSFYDIVIENGAEFIDSDNERIMALIKRYNRNNTPNPINLIKLKKGNSNYLFDYGGEFLSLEELQTRIFQESRSGIDYIVSVSYQMSPKISITELLDNAETKGLFQKTRSFFETLIFTETGVSLDHVGAEFFRFYFQFDMAKEKIKILPDSDEAFKIKGGTSRLVEALQKETEALGVKFALGQTVQKVTQIENGFKVTTDKLVLEGDDVIISIPPWEIHRIGFEVPEIKNVELQAFKSFPKSNATKLYLFFDKRFWQHSGIFNGYLNTQDLGTSFQFFDSSQGQDQTEKGALLIYSGFLPQSLEEQNDFIEKVLYHLELSFPDVDVKSHLIGEHFFIKEGSYSLDTVLNRTALLQPYLDMIENWPFHFVGEAWSREHTGYIEGALDTAQEAAYSILELSKKPLQCFQFL